MDASEVADQIRELKEEQSRDEELRSRAALVIAFMAMLLAITSMGGGNATKEMMSANVQASDTWSFYQAKSIRQTSQRLAADALDAELQIHQGALAPDVQESLRRRADEYRRTADRYEDEPDPTDPGNPLKGEGRKQLSARAQDFEAKRDRAQRQDPNFDFAEAFFQIAIVLGSVSILATSRRILLASVVVGLAATLLMLNGYFLFFNLPL